MNQKCKKSTVLVVSRTNMTNYRKVCIGAIDIQTKQPMRLKNINGHNFEDTVDFQIGGIWDINYITPHSSSIIAPHVENVNVVKKCYKKDCRGLLSILRDDMKVPTWEGSPDCLFDGMVRATPSGSGYIGSQDIPVNSTGFWICDLALSKYSFENNSGKVTIRYTYPGQSNVKSLKFVGQQTSVADIPRGTLLRVSLSSWFQPPGMDVRGCWLQLSGWYS